jgi:hypothetical protein
MSVPDLAGCSNIWLESTLAGRKFAAAGILPEAASETI